MNNNATIVVVVAFVAFGTLTTAQALFTEGLQMNGSHWIMLLVAIAAGYAAGRMFPKAGQMVGLP